MENKSSIKEEEGKLISEIKPVRYGILIGLLCLIFGIGWTFYLVLGHERIHKSLEKVTIEKLHHDTEESHQHSAEDGKKQDIHESPVAELAHRRLVRGHLHAMGLGLVSITVSLILAFTSAKNGVKTIVSTLTGIGGAIYPIAWIVMGYRTPSLGLEGAEASVVVIAGPAVILILTGIFTAIIFLVKDIFSRSRNYDTQVQE